MKPLNLLLIWVFTTQLSAQITKPIHSENLALGISNSLGVNFQSGSHNPANIQLDSSRFRIGISFSNFFFTKELNQVSLSGQVRIKKGGMAVTYSNLGWSNIAQHYLNIAYGLEIAKGFRLGIACHYHLTKIPEEELHQGIFPSFGINYQHKRKFQIAFFVDNPIAINWISNKEKMPITFDFGFKLNFTNSLSGQLELVKTLNTPLRLSIGFQYSINDRIIPRIACSLLPLGVAAGVGFKLKKIQIGIAMWYGHPLGPITHFDSSYEN